MRIDSRRRVVEPEIDIEYEMVANSLAPFTKPLPMVYGRDAYEDAHLKLAEAEKDLKEMFKRVVEVMMPLPHIIETVTRAKQSVENARRRRYD